jgi:ABC-type multidrug transport system fused ATPase/permease subunit
MSGLVVSRRRRCRERILSRFFDHEFRRRHSNSPRCSLPHVTGWLRSLASFVGSESTPHSLFPELSMTSTETTTATASDANKILDINVNDLTFRYQAGQRPILSNLNMQLTDGARCLLIGANGAGLLPPSPPLRHSSVPHRKINTP